MPLAFLGARSSVRKTNVTSTVALRSLQQVTAAPPIVRRTVAPTPISAQTFRFPSQLVPVRTIARPAKMLPEGLELPTAPEFQTPLVNISTPQPPNALTTETPDIFNPPVSTGKTGVGFIDKVLEAGEKIAVEIDKVPSTVAQIKAGLKQLPGEAAQAREDLSRAAQLQQMLPWAVVIIIAVVLLKR